MTILRYKPALGLVLVAALGAACSAKVHVHTNGPTKKPETPAAEDLSQLSSNPYRGYDAINYALSQRLVDDAKFELDHYIEDTSDLGIFAAFVSTLKDLLGLQKGQGIASGFRNGTPNSMNVTLWYMAFSGLATDVRGICTSEGNKIGPYQPREAFKNAALALCAWPLPAGTRVDLLHAYWTAMMQLDAPKDEYDAWLAFATSPEMLAVPADEALFNLTFAALYNPHFLVAQ